MFTNDRTFTAKILHLFKQIFSLTLHFSDYILFAALMMWKVLLFDKYTGLMYQSKGVLAYLAGGLRELLLRKNPAPLEEGILLVSLGSVLLLSFWTLFLSKRLRLFSLLALDVLVTFVIISDLIYFRYFSDLISVPVLLQAFQVEAVGASIESLFRFKDILFFIDLMVFLPIAVIYIGLRIRKRFSARSMAEERINSAGGNLGANTGRRFLSPLLVRAASGLVVFMLGFLFVAAPVNAARSTWAKGVLEINWWNLSVYKITGLIGFHAHDFYRYAKDNLLAGERVSPEEKKEVEAWFARHRKQEPDKFPLYGAAKGKNLIVIQGEALQNLVIGQKVNGQEITPNLNKLTRQATYFNNFYHQIAQGGTSDAEFLVLNSLQPLPSGSAFIRMAGNEYEGLPGILKENGYDSAAFHAFKPSFWNRYNMYQSLGFDHFYSKDDFVLDEQVGWSVSDRSFFKQSVDKMKEMKQPFFAFLISLSSHHPFDIPDDYQKLDAGEFNGTLFGDYLQAVHYFDYSIGQMVETLKQEGLWDNSVFVVYGDHDSKAPDDEQLNKFFGRKLNTVDLEKVRNQVPFFIHLPEGEGAGVYTNPAGQLDVGPTLMDLLGIPRQDRYLMGENMFARGDRPVVFRNGAFTDGKTYYIPAPDKVFENGKAYNVVTGEEERLGPLAGEHKQALEELQVSDRMVFGDLIKEFRKKH